jgi:DNA-binding transcriptional ArsR family regulator
MAYAETLVALADPTRRGIYQRLSRRPHTVGELARLSGVSQPAVSQHLRVLSDARLATHEADGTRRVYSASREGLEELRGWIESVWDDALAAYAAADPARRRRQRQGRRKG